MGSGRELRVWMQLFKQGSSFNSALQITDWPSHQAATYNQEGTQNILLLFFSGRTSTDEKEKSLFSGLVPIVFKALN